MQHPKILVVEDDLDFTETLQMALGREQYEFVTARTGQEGLAKAQSERPDLIILDVMMEKPTAEFDLARTLKDPDSGSPYAFCRHTPIILLTAINQRTVFHFEADSDLLPVEAFLEKPVPSEELRKTVERLLTRQG